MIADTLSTARRSVQKSSAKAPMFVPAAPTYAPPVETPGISTEKFLWLGKYLRVKKETSDTWILSEMGWLMENTINFLSDITSKAFDSLLGTVATNIVPVTIVRTPLLILDSMQSKLTANSVSIEVGCNYEHTLTGPATTSTELYICCCMRLRVCATKTMFGKNLPCLITGIPLSYKSLIR